MKELGKSNISSILVEGGSEIYTSFLKENLYDNLLFFISPKLLGDGIPVVDNLGIRGIKKASKLKFNKFEKIGEDLLVELVK